MGAAAVPAQDTLYLKRELYAVSLDMAAVGAIADKGAGTAAGAGEQAWLNMFHEIIVRFLGEGVAFTDRYGYHSFTGGLHPYGWPRCS